MGVNVFVQDGVIREIWARPAGAGGRGCRLWRTGADVRADECTCSCLCGGVEHRSRCAVAYVLPGTFRRGSCARGLRRGFTTLRDVGGADIGLMLAIKDGLLGPVFPRLFYGGRVISQTGGHGDFGPGPTTLEDGGISAAARCTAQGCGRSLRTAVQMRVRKCGARGVPPRGCAGARIMASGGVASPTDPLDRCQYSDDEIQALLSKRLIAPASYVAAQYHPKEAVRRAVAAGGEIGLSMRR